MSSPIDFLLKDPDAMRYAIMTNDGKGMRKGGAVKMAGGGPVWDDSGRMVSPDGTLDQFAQSQFGLDPTRTDRLAYLPQPARTPDGGRDWTDWIAPEWMVGLQRNIATPEYLMRGNPMTDDQLGHIANSTAINTSGGGLGLSHIAPAPNGSLGMAVKSKGNLNLTPAAGVENLKGPETQTVANFMNQVRGQPGVTTDGLESGLAKLKYIDPNAKVTKQWFEGQVRPSEYEKINLEGKSLDNIEHYVDDAHDRISITDALNHAGIPEHLHQPAIDWLFHDVDRPHRELGRMGHTNRDDFDGLIQESKAQLAWDLAREFAEEDIDGGVANYANTQRLIEPDYTSDGHPGSPGSYFEIGVAHPDYKGHYRHFDQAPQGTVGHIRGSFLPEPYMEDAVTIGAGEHSTRVNDPGAMLIEEIQSDANQGVSQTGLLHQIHGTLFKAAVQHALENGASTIYHPRAKTIAAVPDRYNPESSYTPIYDQQVVKEGINPLKKIPGVTVEPVFNDAGTEHIFDKIRVSPEAREHILSGPGQSYPGLGAGKFARGGRVTFTGDVDAMKYELAKAK
jgi:hypothetical protein